MSTSEPTLSTLEERIPPEIVDKILEEAVDAGYAKGIPKTWTSRTLCLVSKTLLPFGQRVLFRSVKLRFGRYGLPLDENGEPEESDQEDDPALLVTNDKPFRRAIHKSPHLGAHVRELSLHLDWLDDEELDYSYVAMVMGDVLSRCPGVVRLHFRQEGGEKSSAVESVLKVFADAGRQLEDLTAYYPSKECWELLSKSTSLRRLDLGVADTEAPLVEDWDTSAPFPSSLTYLRLHQEYASNQLVFASLFLAALTNSTSTLQELHISSILLALTSVQPLLPRLSNLRHLVVNANDLRRTSEPEEDHYQRLFLALAACVTTSLRIEGMHPRNPLPSTFFPSLPRSITQLDISGLHKKETGISEWIDKAESLNLKSLMVTWPMATEDEPKLALRQACEKKGVKLLTRRG